MLACGSRLQSASWQRDMTISNRDKKLDGHIFIRTQEAMREKSKA